MIGSELRDWRKRNRYTQDMLSTVATVSSALKEPRQRSKRKDHFEIFKRLAP